MKTPIENFEAGDIIKSSDDKYEYIIMERLYTLLHKHIKGYSVSYLSYDRKIMIIETWNLEDLRIDGDYRDVISKIKERK